MNKSASPSIAERTVVVILAAGKGTRMGQADMAKVCFEIDGVAAINRTIATFKKKKFNKFLLVVGSNAEQVMETIAREHPEISFVFQNPPLGTGHAARVACPAARADWRAARADSSGGHLKRQKPKPPSTPAFNPNLK